MKTGFLHIDGNEAMGRAPAAPHHWLAAMVAVIVAQWLCWQGGALGSLVASVLLGLDFFSEAENAWIWIYVVANLIFLLVPTAIIAWSCFYFTRRIDGRSARAIGVDAATAPLALIWSLAGLFAAAPVITATLLNQPALEGVMQGVTVLAPVTIVQAGAEEVLFRGVILGFVSARYGVRTGVLISALLFGLWHVQLGQSLIDSATSFGWTLVFGITTAIVTLHYANLGPALALHVVWNVTNDLHGGSLHGGSLGVDFWSSWVATFSVPWTIEDFTSGKLFRFTLAPLALQTLIVFATCRETVSRLLSQDRVVA